MINDVARNETATLFINLAAWAERSVVNGPGERFVVWVQGCPLNCEGCFNPDFIPLDIVRRLMPVKDLAARILATPNIEGVTYSGGEPMMQAAALVALTRELKKHGLTIVCYSGFTLESLRAKKETGVQELLGLLDVLIDGPYQSSEAAALPWRGSRNQRVHFLSSAYAHLMETVQQNARQVELIVGERNWALTGTWENEFAQRLQRALTDSPYACNSGSNR